MKKLLISLAICAVLGGGILNTATAQEKADTAKNAKTFEKISFEDLKKAIEEKKVTILDYNGNESYANGRIPGAINGKAEGLDAKLPADKNALIVSYCGSEKCQAWQEGAKKASALGYTNIKHLAIGIKGWKEAGGALEK